MAEGEAVAVGGRALVGLDQLPAHEEVERRLHLFLPDAGGGRLEGRHGAAQKSAPTTAAAPITDRSRGGRRSRRADSRA